MQLKKLWQNSRKTTPGHRLITMAQSQRYGHLDTGDGEKIIYNNSLTILRKNFNDLVAQKQGRFQALDGLRAIAILQVILFHCLLLNYAAIPGEKRVALFEMMSPWFNWLWQGDKGVDLFFVLSGFLITMLLLKEHDLRGRVDNLGYLKRRAGRILPAYLLLLFVGWLTGQPNNQNLLANLLFINNVVNSDSLFLPWTWSITVEVQFYVIFPLVILPALLYSRRPLTIALLLVLLAITVRQLVISDNYDLVTTPFYDQLYNSVLFQPWWDEIYIQLYTRGGPITFGIAAAVIYTYHDDRLSDFITVHPVVTRLIIILALTTAFLAHSIPYHDPTQAYLDRIGATGNYWLLGLHRNIYALCSTVILLFVIKPRPYFGLLYRVLTNRVLGFIAKISYSAYLFHILILNQVYHYLSLVLPNKIGDPTWLLVGALIAMTITAIVSAMIYVLLEKPFIDLTHSKKGD
jgi:peptidoglycan/LPS O-acetylase OafA/YrhL